MSKIVVLFVVLAALVQNHGSFASKHDDKPEKMDEAQLKLRQQVIESKNRYFFINEIRGLEQKYQVVNVHITEKFQKIVEDAESINRRAEDRKRAVCKKAKDSIFDITVKSLGVPGTEPCYDMYSDIRPRGQLLLSRVNKCTTDILNAASENVAEAKAIYETFYETVLEWRDRYNGCAHFFPVVTQLENNIFCNEAIQNVTAPLLEWPIQHTFNRIGDTVGVLSGLIRDIGACDKDFVEYETKAPELTHKAYQCYKRKMEEAARHAIPATTEKTIKGTLNH